MPTQCYDRISLRGNFDQFVGKYFHFGLSTNNSYRKTQGVNNIYGVLSMPPIVSPYDEEGNLRSWVSLPADDQVVITKEKVEGWKDVWRP